MTSRARWRKWTATEATDLLGGVRGVLTTTVLVVVYYVLPLDQPWNGNTAVRVLIGLLVFAGIAVWQVRSIATSRYPSMKAFEATFTQPLTRTDALYFTVTVFSTVGFGDITAKSEAARVLLIVQMLGPAR